MDVPTAGRDEDAPAKEADVGGVVQRRRRLRGALDELESALARAGRPRDVWTERVAEAVARLATAMEDHVTETEGPDGFFDTVLRDAPRAANGVERLRREHDTMHAAIRGLANRLRAGADGDDEVELVREEGLDLIHLTNRHRQRGADLLYDAYQLDIGAGD